MNQRMIGTKAEALAGRFLTEQGYTVLARQYRTKAGELDLVYRKGTLLIFGEVKCRTALRYGKPIEAVDAAKRAHIVAAAKLYLQKERAPYESIRFDVIEVLSDGGKYYIKVNEQAFRPGE